MHRVVIIGGGISGLAAAYFLEKYAGDAGFASDGGLSIQLLEARDRLGGVILTERTDGFVLEGGPDSFLSTKPAAVELCRALGLADDLTPSNDRQRKTFILQGGELKELPEGLQFVVPTKFWPIFRGNLFSLSGKIRLALAPFLWQPQAQGDPSVAEFVTQRFGRQALERLAEPLLSAVYGADVNSLSTRAALPQFLALEEKHGSLWKGIRQARRAAAAKPKSSPGSIFITLRGGVGQLIDSLESNLVNTQVTTGCNVERISRSESGAGFRVCWQGGETEASAVILATPAHGAEKLLGELAPQLSGKLGEIPYHSTVTVSLGFERATFGRDLNGFGFVVARGERTRLIACTWVSTKFPARCPSDRVLLRCFLGGARDPSIIEEDDQQIIRMVLRDLQEIMGIRSEPLFTRIHRWERSMAQYSVGHLERLQEITGLLSKQPGLFLTGNAYKGIGIPDCIDASSTAASAAVQYLHSPR